jgi:hypothetical protein
VPREQVIGDLEDLAGDGDDRLFGAIAFLNRRLVGSMLESRRAKDGWTLRIDLERDEFAICDVTGGLRTYYKPNPFRHGKGDNLRYFRKRCSQ